MSAPRLRRPPRSSRNWPVVLALVLPLLSAGPAPASDWLGGVSSDWFVGDNWINPVGVPTAGDLAVINTAPPVSAAASIDVATLLIGTVSGGTGGLTADANVATSFFGVGANFSNTPGTASGSLSVGGNLIPPAASVSSGLIGTGATGTPDGIGRGRVRVTGDVGPLSSVFVGSSTGDAGLAGGPGIGSLTVGGNLVIDGLAAGTVFNGGAAAGTIAVGGAISASFAAVGVVSDFSGPGGSTATGTVTSQSISLTQQTSLVVGFNQSFSLGAPGGSATGTLEALSGSISLAPGAFASIGTAFVGNSQGTTSATGTLGLGGTLTGGGGGAGLFVGVAMGGPGAATAVGTATLGGVSGFDGYLIGVTQGAGAATTAQGTLVLGSGGLQGATPFNSLNIGHAAGGAATGVVQVNGGSVTSLSFISVGSADAAGGSGTGTLAVTGGSIAATGGINVGSLNQGSGPTRGDLVLADGGLATPSLVIGSNFSAGGATEGSARFTRSTIEVTATSPGFGVVSVGDGFGPGNASGELTLIDSTMRVQDIVSLGAGLPGLASGTLSLTRSLLDVGGGLLSLGVGSLVHFDLDGLLRGTEYGAIDAGVAFLDGGLEILLDFALAPGVHTFDLIVAGPPNGAIFGFPPGIYGACAGIGDATACFDSVDVLGLPGGFAWSLQLLPFEGTETAEILRLTISSVPGPSPFFLLALGAPVLLALPVLRRSGGGRRAGQDSPGAPDRPGQPAD